MAPRKRPKNWLGENFSLRSLRWMKARDEKRRLHNWLLSLENRAIAGKEEAPIAKKILAAKRRLALLSKKFPTA